VDKEHSYRWLKFGDIKRKTESTVVETLREKQKAQWWRHQRKNRKLSSGDIRGKTESAVVEILREKQRAQ